jgi:hypothetical protein
MRVGCGSAIRSRSGGAVSGLCVPHLSDCRNSLQLRRGLLMVRISLRSLLNYLRSVAYSTFVISCSNQVLTCIRILELYSMTSELISPTLDVASLFTEEMIVYGFVDGDGVENEGWAQRLCGIVANRKRHPWEITQLVLSKNFLYRDLPVCSY